MQYIINKADYTFVKDGVITSEAQWDFLLSNNPIVAFIGGMGSGKSYVGLRKALLAHLTLKNNKDNKSNGMIIMPTFHLYKSLFQDAFMELLFELDIPAKCNIADHTIITPHGTIRGYQAQTAERIVGANLTWAYIDEFDVVPTKRALLLFSKILGRLRGHQNAQLFMTSTPEGYGAMYNIFEEQKEKNGSIYFTCASTASPYLPPNYIKLMQENYDSKQLKAYLEGKFVNLTAGSCYEFDRERNVKDLEFNPTEPLYLSCDFNAGQDTPMSWILAQRDIENIYVIEELYKFRCNTSKMLEYLDERLREMYNGKYPRSITLTGDYSGNRSSSSSDQTDWQLIKNYFKKVGVSIVDNIKRCKSVRNQIKNVNARLEHEHIFISPNCVELIKDMEQTAWDSSGMREDQSDPKRSHLSSALRYLVDAELPIAERIRRI